MCDRSQLYKARPLHCADRTGPPVSDAHQTCSRNYNDTDTGNVLPHTTEHTQSCSLSPHIYHSTANGPQDTQVYHRSQVLLGGLFVQSTYPSDSTQKLSNPPHIPRPSLMSPRMMAAAHKDAANRHPAPISVRLRSSTCPADPGREPARQAQENRTGKRYALASRAKRTRVAGEPGHYAAQLVGAPNAPERVQARPLVQQMRLRIKVCCGHAAKKERRQLLPPQRSTSLPARV